MKRKIIIFYISVTLYGICAVGLMSCGAEENGATEDMPSHVTEDVEASEDLTESEIIEETSNPGASESITRIINFEDWDMEDTVSARALTVEDFESIRLGSSLDHIANVLGEPDGYVGDNEEIPVYVLQDQSVVELFFEDDTFEHLNLISQIIDQTEIVLKEMEDTNLVVGTTRTMNVLGWWDLEYIVTDRKLILKDFESIHPGDTYQEIVSKFGEPDGYLGTGMLYPVYVLQDDSVVHIAFDNDYYFHPDEVGRLTRANLYRGEKLYLLKIGEGYNVVGTKRLISFSGWEFVYAIPDRELSTEDFENIELGTTYEEIVSELGEPDGYIGANKIWPLYVLEDDSVVKLYFEGVDTKSGTDLKLIEIDQYRGDEKIVLKE